MPNLPRILHIPDAGSSLHPSASRQPETRATSEEPPRKKQDRRQTGCDFPNAATMINQVKADTGRILHILEKPRLEEKQQTVPYDEELLRAARSVDALKTASGQYLVSDESKGIIYCSVCAPEKPTSTKTGHALAGTFGYNFGLGSKFSVQEKLPTEFRLMKSSVGTHLKSAAHVKRVEDDVKRRETKEAREKTTVKADMNVLRTAYHVMKESGSGESFSKWILTQRNNGADMGNINHSKALMPAARLAFHDVIIKKLKEYVATQPCLSVLVDKVTINRRTVDITAVLVVVPEAPTSHLLQSFVVRAPVVKQHDGDALAKEIQETLATIGVTSTEKVAAIAADGQYHRLGVPEKLLKGMRAEEGQVNKGPISVAAIWDSAHLMNLADSDARKACPWVQETTKVISDISKRFMYGKGLEELAGMGKKMGVKVRRLKLWSGTRFAPHAATVLQAFIHNWEVMVAVLGERFQTETRKEYAEEILADLRKLKGWSKFFVSITLFVYLKEVWFASL